MAPDSTVPAANEHVKRTGKRVSPWWEVIGLITWSCAVGVSTVPLIGLLRSPKNDYEWIYFTLMTLAYVALAATSALRIVRKEKRTTLSPLPSASKT
jgi:hypothetical protein